MKGGKNKMETQTKQPTEEQEATLKPYDWNISHASSEIRRYAGEIAKTIGVVAIPTLSSLYASSQIANENQSGFIATLGIGYGLVSTLLYAIPSISEKVRSIKDMRYVINRDRQREKLLENRV